MPFAIESGVDRRAHLPSIYPFRQMKVGDCFHVEDRKSFDRARTAAYVFSTRYPEYKFSCKINGPHLEGGRIWRVK